MELGAAGLLLDDDAGAPRIGALLHVARRATGLRRKEAAARASVRTRDLRAWERAEADVPDDALARLAALYGSAFDDLVGVRVPLRVTADRVVAGTHEQPFDPSDRDAAFRAYAHLILRLRGTRRGEPVPLRAGDLAVLALAIGSDPDEVAGRVMAVLGCTRGEAEAMHAAVLQRRVLVPAAGFALGAVALASVAFTAPAEPPPAATPGVSAPASAVRDAPGPGATPERPVSTPRTARDDAAAPTPPAGGSSAASGVAAPEAVETVEAQVESPAVVPDGPGEGPVVTVPEGEVFIEIGEPLVVEAPEGREAPGPPGAPEGDGS